jgi:hypothetical protein
MRPREVTRVVTCDLSSSPLIRGPAAAWESAAVGAAALAYRPVVVAVELALRLVAAMSVWQSG